MGIKDCKIDNWKLQYNGFDSEQESLRESLCMLGNGYLGTRGAATEALPSEIHYPGTYIRGLYNRLPTHIAGRTIYNEDMVNCPNWLYLTFRVDDGEWFCPGVSPLLSYKITLNIREGMLVREMRFKSKNGRRTKVVESRLVHMSKPHLAALSYTITPENYDGNIVVHSLLDGAVLNMNVKRYRQLNFHHWKTHSLGRFSDNGVYLGLRTTQSKIELAQAARLRVFINGREKNVSMEEIQHGKNVIGLQAGIRVRQGQSLSLEKTVTVYSSRDREAEGKPIEAAVKEVSSASRFERLRESHCRAWERLWDRYDMTIKGDAFSQNVLRFHMFHLLQTASPLCGDRDAGLPARGLHGEAYRGHIFWDELFVLPAFNMNSPSVTKNILLYRFRRLNKAREYARNNGYQGAMFPWQSGSTGEEETQEVHLNPLSGKWGPDYSRLQRHVSLAIAYNVLKYWQTTGDRDFLENQGAEILLAIAKFFASLMEYDRNDDRFHSRRVMGPDEFHEKFPNSDIPGINDNAYTNVMVVWLLNEVYEVISVLSAKVRSRLLKKLKITPEEMGCWDEIIRKTKVSVRDGIIEQFSGYFRLRELNWEMYRKKYKDIHRLDRILKAEGRSPDAYKVSKQADVLMLFYVLSLPEIKRVMEKLGYGFDRSMVKKNYEYYLQRTSHGSTLSKVVHCYVANLLGREKEGWRWFQEVLNSDLRDVQGGTTPEGVHLGVMGGSVDVVLRSFAGIEITDNHLRIKPNLPRAWDKLGFKFVYRKQLIALEVTRRELSLKLLRGARPLSVEINSEMKIVPIGRTLKVTLKS